MKVSDNAKIPLVASEITGLWNSYMGDSMALCVLRYLLNKNQDDEARPILQYALDLSVQHLQKLTAIMNEASFPIPHGFTESDVDVNAPPLFTDAFSLAYLAFMARVGMLDYVIVLNGAARSDIREYFSNCITESVELYNKVSELRLAKGLFIRAPRVEIPKTVQYIEESSFMVDWFGEKRPLILRELTHIFKIILSNVVGRALITGFAQTAQQKKVVNYLLRGAELATEQINSLTPVLSNEAIPIPVPSDSFVTDTTIPPFSEKLMLFHIVAMNSAAVNSVGMAVADSLRSDLQTKYIGFITSILKYAKDGADIMIKNKWLEQPPQAISHAKLAQSK